MGKINILVVGGIIFAFSRISTMDDKKKEQCTEAVCVNEKLMQIHRITNNIQLNLGTIGSNFHTLAMEESDETRNKGFLNIYTQTSELWCRVCSLHSTKKVLQKKYSAISYSSLATLTSDFEQLEKLNENSEEYQNMTRIVRELNWKILQAQEENKDRKIVQLQSKQ